MTTRSYSLPFPQVHARPYGPLKEGTQNTSTDVPPAEESALRSTLLPILAQRFRTNTLEEAGQDIRERIESDWDQIAKPYSTRLESQSNTPTTPDAPLGSKSYKAGSCSHEGPSEAVEDATPIGEGVGIHPCSSGHQNSDAHPTTIGGGGRPNLDSSMSTTDSWITLEGSEAEAWDLTPHAIERCESPSRMEDVRPFAYKILPIHGTQCLVKVLVSIPKPPPQELRGKYVTDFRAYTIEDSTNSERPAINISEVPAITSNTYYQTPEPGLYISFTVNRSHAGALPMATECIGRIESLLSDSPVAQDVVDPIQYAFVEPRDGDIYVENDNASGLVVFRIAEFVPHFDGTEGVPAQDAFVRGKVAGRDDRYYGLVSYDDSQPHRMVHLLAAEFHSEDDDEVRVVLESCLERASRQLEEQSLVSEPSARRYLPLARKGRRNTASRHKGKGNKRWRVEMEGKWGRKRVGTAPNRSRRRQSAMDRNCEPRGIESIGGRGEQMRSDRAVGVVGGERVETEGDDQRGPRSSHPTGGTRRHSILQDVGANTELPQSNLSPGSPARQLSSMGSIDSVLQPGSPAHPGFSLGDWIRESRSESPVPLDDSGSRQARPLERGGSPFSSFELAKAEAGGVAAADDIPWYGRTFSRASYSGSFELAMAEAGRIGGGQESLSGGRISELHVAPLFSRSGRGLEGSFPLSTESAQANFAEELARRLRRAGGRSTLTASNALQLHLESTPRIFPRRQFDFTGSPRSHTNESSASLPAQLDGGCPVAPRIPPRPLPSALTPPVISADSPPRPSQILAPRIPFQSLPLLSPEGTQSLRLQVTSTDAQGRCPIQQPLIPGTSTQPPGRHDYMPLWQADSTMSRRSWSRRTSGPPPRRIPGPSILSPLHLPIARDLNGNSHLLFAGDMMDVGGLDNFHPNLISSNAFQSHIPSVDRPGLSS